MVRDSRIRMRDGLVIPGTLLTVYGLLAIIYAEVVRSRSDFCADSNLILIAGICYTVWKLLLPLVLVGIALIVAGILAFRGQPDELESHLHAGTPTHTLMAFLVSLVAVPGVAWLIQTIRQADRSPFELEIVGIQFQHTFLLELVMLLGLLMLVPAMVIHVGHMRRHRDFMLAATKEMQGDKQPLPHEAGFVHTKAAAKPDDDMVPDDHWPATRDRDDSKPAPAEAAPAAKPAASPQPVASDASAAPVGGKLPEPPKPAESPAEPDEPKRCQATTAAGNQCRVRAKTGSKYCGVHEK